MIEPMEDMKWCVKQGSSWRKINKDLATINQTSEKSKRESWCRGTICDGEGQLVFNLRNQAYYEESYITKCQSLLNIEMKWLGYQKWKLIMRCEVLQITTSKSQSQIKIKCGNPHEVKKK
jgi:hypothetical protein